MEIEASSDGLLTSRMVDLPARLVKVNFFNFGPWDYEGSQRSLLLILMIDFPIELFFTLHLIYIVNYLFTSNDD